MKRSEDNLPEGYVILDGKWFKEQAKIALHNYFLPFIWVWALIRRKPLPSFK